MYSKNGFSTKHWGPQGWRLLHLIALNLDPLYVPTQRRKEYVDFFRSFSNILPCGACRDEFKKLLYSDKFKLHTGRFIDRDTAFKYTVDLHSAVNIRLKKKHVKSVRQWREFYEKMRSVN